MAPKQSIPHRVLDEGVGNPSILSTRRQAIRRARPEPLHDSRSKSASRRVERISSWAGQGSTGRDAPIVGLRRRNSTARRPGCSSFRFAACSPPARRPPVRPCPSRPAARSDPRGRPARGRPGRRRSASGSIRGSRPRSPICYTEVRHLRPSDRPASPRLGPPSAGASRARADERPSW